MSTQRRDQEASQATVVSNKDGDSAPNTPSTTWEKIKSVRLEAFVILGQTILKWKGIVGLVANRTIIRFGVASSLGGYVLTVYCGGTVIYTFLPEKNKAKVDQIITTMKQAVREKMFSPHELIVYLRSLDVMGGKTASKL
jgi:hypothetical protein